MQKNFDLKLFYLYLASFTALVFFLFGAVFTAQNLVEIIGSNAYYPTYTQFRTRYDKMENGGEMLQPDTQELRLAYEEEKQQSLQQARRRAGQNLAGSGTALILGLFFWLFFWKQTKEK